MQKRMATGIMETYVLTASKKPNKKDVEDYKAFLKREGFGRLVVKIEGQEDMVIEVERKDADGRELLQD